MCKCRLCVYPYGAEFEPIIEHAVLLNSEYEIYELVAPKGWLLDGSAIRVNSKNIIVKSSLVDAAKNTDVLLIPEFYVSEQFKNTVIKNVVSIVSHLRRVICAVSLEHKQYIELKTACESASCILEIRNESCQPIDYSLYEGPNELDKISVPIIVIAGLWENTDKFKVSLALRERLLSEGYKVSQIGTRNYCDMLGFHSFPAFMSNCSIDEAKKILLFNKYVKKMVDDENPDVVIIGIPGEMCSLNSRFVGKFGVLAYLVFKAIVVDFLIACVFYDHTNDEYLKIISETCKYRFDTPVDCFHMSGFFVDMMKSDLISSVFMEKATREMIDNSMKINTTPLIPIIDVYNKNSFEQLYNLLMLKLRDESIDVLF